ncbi:Tox-REase-5 domain-containing protein, partial [Pyxidicoccus sp. 3LFB2]
PEPVGGPGRWGPSRELLSPRAARYQEQRSARPASEAYWLGEVGRKGVRFDGFEAGVLLDTRGPGLASRFNEDLSPKPWFARWGVKELLEQARRQHTAARGVGARVRWHVAEERAARAVRKLLEANQLSEVEVVHTAAMP